MTTSKTESNWPDWMGDLPPETVYDMHGRLLLSFSARTSQGRLVLASLCGEDQDAELLYYLIATTTPTVLEALTTGRMTAREGLTAGWLWKAVRRFDNTWVSAVPVLEADVAELLPEPGTMFTYELEPAFTLRATGDTISSTHVTANIITKTIESARKALKSLADYVLEAKGTGRSNQSVETFYNLPVQSTAYASFQVSFAAPQRPPPPAGQLQPAKPDPEEEAFIEEVGEQIWDSLARGVEQLATGRLSPQGWESPEEYIAVLGALEQLTPPQNGPIQQMHVSGAFLDDPSEPVVLDRKMSRKVRKLLDEQKDPPQTIRVPARVVLIDAKNAEEMKFDILPVGAAEVEENYLRCVFAEDAAPGGPALVAKALNEFKDLREEAEPVSVVGVVTPKKKTMKVYAVVSDISDLPTLLRNVAGPEE